MAYGSFIGKLCLFLALGSITLAAPVVELDSDVDTRSSNKTHLIQKRVLGDKNDPFPATFDIADWPDIAEQDCFAMLCLQNAQRTYQRQLTADEPVNSYRKSGAAAVPFRADQLAGRHTAQINPRTTSAEEFPWRSIHILDRDTRYLFPATLYQQSRQGNAVQRGYRGGANIIDFGKWFRITFTGAPLGTFCAALHASPPDFSVCKKQTKETLFGTARVILANFVYQIVRKNRSISYIHSAGRNKGKRAVAWEDNAPQEADE